MATKAVSIREYTTGKTAPFWRILQKNLYHKNWKDAPAMQRFICIWTFATIFQLAIIRLTEATL